MIHPHKWLHLRFHSMLFPLSKVLVGHMSVFTFLLTDTVGSYGTLLQFPMAFGSLHRTSKWSGVSFVLVWFGCGVLRVICVWVHTAAGSSQFCPVSAVRVSHSKGRRLLLADS